MEYEEAWRFLDNLQFFKIKLGLAAMSSFLGRLNNPQEKIPFIHIGGTNGKGSVAATLTTILTGAGYRVGLYTSPHLSDVRERFRIGDTHISRKEFSSVAQRIIRILDGEQITYFEFTTALAMLWFAERQVDLAILEVGMGGRLDATNVITPLVSVITNVGFDHQQYLGTRLEEIAAEKAGIIKPGVPVISGVAEPEAAGVIRNRCSAQKAPLYRLGHDFVAERIEKNRWNYSGLNNLAYKELPLAMRGGYQAANAALALAALQLLPEPQFQVSETAVRTGLAQTRWPGRLEEIVVTSGQIPGLPVNGARCRFLLDGAHNVAGVQALKRALEDEFSYDRLYLLWGAMADKELADTLELVAPLAESIIFTRPESERSARPEELLACLPPELRHRARGEKNVEKALAALIQDAGEQDLVCVAGSLYLVGRVRTLLKGELVHDQS